jgi:phosphoribosyl-AMP cyclohydrolase
VVTFSLSAAALLVDSLAFDRHDLLPAIAVRESNNEVLMQAWVNREALLETLTSGRVCYYSRSKQGLWRKGDTSGHIQHLRALRVDCDRDSILLLVEQVGAACHTFRPNCYYDEAMPEGTWRTLTTPIQNSE